MKKLFVLFLFGLLAAISLTLPVLAEDVAVTGVKITTDSNFTMSTYSTRFLNYVVKFPGNFVEITKTGIFRIPVSTDSLQSFYEGRTEHHSVRPIRQSAPMPQLPFRTGSCPHLLPFLRWPSYSVQNPLC